MEGKIKGIIINLVLIVLASGIGYGSAWLVIKKPEAVSRCDNVEANVQKFFDQTNSNQSADKNSTITTNSKGKPFVASKNGTKYYIDGKGYSSRIKEENKIYFDTQEDAKAAGYEPGSGVE